uniref:fumarate hydratase n=1 Tax=Alexandrium monilatum TaxID=311494 RepID=A0A7S4RZ46_9DINO|mmetsp:Transcript_11408/g.34409  ORF Transcript_11408/g.34409 Transcript_11408/m.34409 type:complete len:587 (-) Transcript_11408:135-1895(-)
MLGARGHMAPGRTATAAWAWARPVSLQRLRGRPFSQGPSAAESILTPKAAPFLFEPVLQPDACKGPTPFRQLKDLSSGLQAERLKDGRTLLHVEPWVLSSLARQAMDDVSHLFRPGHLTQLQEILRDPEASANDRLVGRELLKNAVVSANRHLPSCQDTGTATVVASRGNLLMTDGHDAEHFSRGIYEAYVQGNLRYSQMAPIGMFEEVNTKCNLPAQVDISAGSGNAYDILFIAKGGGSANKTKLLQKTKAVLREDAFLKMMEEEIKALGTAACPPYHLAVVVGGLSPDMTMKAVKLLASHELDGLPRDGSAAGRAIRDLEWEEKITELCRNMGIGAQFGGKYFVHDVRVARLPRHGGSCPIGIGVSCSAHRQIRARISEDGVFLEQLEEEPENYLVVEEGDLGGDVHHVNLDDDPRGALTKLSVSSRVLLTGKMLVARDIAHAKIKARLDEGEPLPQYLREHALFYAGPSKTPEGMPSGSFGPTSAVRMDDYVEEFQRHGGSLIMIGKGNRTRPVTRSCKQHGGFYLGTIGGMAAQLTANCIRAVEVLDMPELGMEAVFRIQVENFPAFIVVDDKGNDFFSKWM